MPLCAAHKEAMKLVVPLVWLPHNPNQQAVSNKYTKRNKARTPAPEIGSHASAQRVLRELPNWFRNKRLPH